MHVAEEHCHGNKHDCATPACDHFSFNLTDDV
jgi:hypothetical protein